MLLLLGSGYSQTIDTNNYRKYNSGNESFARGVILNTGNDILAFNNQDREYTGAVRLGIISDVFDFKVFSFRNDEDWDSFQEFYFGLDVYTPDSIKSCPFGSIDPLECLIDTLDRPFGSTVFIGRKRHIIHRSGKKRATSNFMLGIIGSNSGRKFQSLLHRDIAGSSDEPTGWITQVADGGRLAIQYQLSGDYLLIGDEGYIMNKNISSINLRVGYQFEVGLLNNSAGLSIGLSNKNFKELDPTYFIRRSKNVNICSRICETFFYDLSANVNYVGYNTYLQGYPVLDEDSDKLEYTLQNDQIRRFTSKYSLALGFKMHKSTLFYQYILFSPEYKSGVWHNFGVIGVNLEIYD